MTSYIEWKAWNSDPIPYSDCEHQALRTTDYDDPRCRPNDIVPDPIPGHSAKDADFNPVIASGSRTSSSPVLPEARRESPRNPTPLEVMQRVSLVTSAAPTSSSSASFKPSSLRRRRSSSYTPAVTQVFGEISSDSEEGEEDDEEDEA